MKESELYILDFEINMYSKLLQLPEHKDTQYRSAYFQKILDVCKRRKQELLNKNNNHE